ncbi:MAG TPA: DUF4440 domain-containing protein [Terriglobales bacterium]|nr:DUF4440 domain-containing protein [Terriglobales bacterium]
MRRAQFLCAVTLLFSLRILYSGRAAAEALHSPQSRYGTGAGNSRKDIEEFNRRFVDACRSMDHKAAIDMWADDGVDLLPGMDPMIGKETIAAWLNGLEAQMKGAKVTQCDVDWQQIQVAGTVAYEWGINTQTVSVPDHPEPFKNKGKITLILRKQLDGSWKQVLESWNNSPQDKGK